MIVTLCVLKTNSHSFSLAIFIIVKTCICSHGEFVSGMFVKRDIKIDYLHIDADHTFDGIKKDFELYSKIMNKGGIITIHDTDKSYVDNFTEIDGHEGDDLSGPSEFVKTIDKRKFEVMNFFNHGIVKDKPSSTGLTIVRKK